MKFAKRTLLFIAVNILVVLTIHLVLSLLGLNLRFRGHNYEALMLGCLVWGMGGAFISLAISRWMAKMFMGVQVVDPRTDDPELRELVRMVHTMAQRARLPAMPEVGIYDSPEVNAFATGPSRSSSLVAVSTGLLRSMNRSQVEGIIGHEVAHIANGDMVTMTLIQGVINAFVLFLARVVAFFVAQAMRSRDDERGGGWIEWILVWVFEIVFGILGALVVNWFSRWREFRADAGGAQYAGRAEMISGLRALQQIHAQAAAGGVAPTHDTSGFQSLKISNDSPAWLHLFATHPPLDDRIARLEQRAS